MTDTRIHPVTGQVLTRQVRLQTVSFGSLSAEVDVPGWYPEDDSDSIHAGRDLDKKEEVFQELRQAYGKRVRKIRKDLKLTQVEAGSIIGGGPRAFQKYERGAMAPSEAAIGLLEILSVDPGKLSILKDVRKFNSSINEGVDARRGGGGHSRRDPASARAIDNLTERVVSAS